MNHFFSYSDLRSTAYMFSFNVFSLFSFSSCFLFHASVAVLMREIWSMFYSVQMLVVSKMRKKAHLKMAFYVKSNSRMQKYRSLHQQKQRRLNLIFRRFHHHSLGWSFRSWSSRSPVAAELAAHRYED